MIWGAERCVVAKEERGGRWGPTSWRGTGICTCYSRWLTPHSSQPFTQVCSPYHEQNSLLLRIHGEQNSRRACRWSDFEWHDYTRIPRTRTWNTFLHSFLVKFSSILEEPSLAYINTITSISKKGISRLTKQSKEQIIRHKLDWLVNWFSFHEWIKRALKILDMESERVEKIFIMTFIWIYWYLSFTLLRILEFNFISEIS